MLRKRILTNTAINTAGKLLAFILQLFIITYLIKSLGKDNYGIVVLALALIGNSNLLEAGFGLSVTKYVAEYKAKNDRRRLLEIFNTNFIVITTLALFFCFVVLVINEYFLDKIFAIPYEMIASTKNLIRILILLSLIEFWSVAIVRTAEGLQQYLVLRMAELSKWFLRAIFIVIAIKGGYGLSGIGAAYLFAGIVNLIVLYLFIVIRIPDLKLDLRLSTMEAFKLLFGFSIWIFLSKIFAFISYRIDTIVIGIFLPPVNLTYYNVAFKIYELLRFGFSLIASTLVPVTSELNSLMDKQKLSLLFKKASKYTVMLMYPLLLFSFFYVCEIIKLWIGNSFNTSALLTKLFIVSLFMTALISSGSEMMVGLNRVKELAIYAGVGSIVNLIISITLIRTIGIPGVVIGTLIGSFIMSVFYLYKILQSFNIGVVSFFKDVFIKPLILTAIMIVLFLFTDNLYIGLIYVICCFLFAFNFMIDADDKRAVLKLIKMEKATA